jgi:hypothetical protein
MDTTPKTEEKWTHRNGITYTIVGIANDPPTEKHPLTVVYAGVNGKLWSRPLTDWHRSFFRANETSPSVGEKGK